MIGCGGVANHIHLKHAYLIKEMGIIGIKGIIGTKGLEQKEIVHMSILGAWNKQLTCAY